MKLLSILTLLAFSCSVAFGQLTIRPQVGINFPKLTDDIAQGNWEGEVGYQLGADVQLGGAIYFQPGVNFQTTRLSVSGVGDLETSRINLSVLAGLRLIDADGGILGLRAFAGPNFGINVDKSLDEAFQEINKDNIRDSQVSGLVGAGVDIGIFFLDVGYNFGLNKFFEDTANDSNENIFKVNVGINLGG